LDDLAEDERVDDGEAVLPYADPLPLQQLPVQAEEVRRGTIAMPAAMREIDSRCKR
jgi:hypothetical protein